MKTESQYCKTYSIYVWSDHPPNVNSKMNIYVCSCSIRCQMNRFVETYGDTMGSNLLKRMLAKVQNHSYSNLYE